MRSACAAVLGPLLLVGCSMSDPTPDSASSTAGQPAAAGSKPSPTETVPPVPQDLTVTLAESDRPTSKEDLARELPKRFASNFYDPFIQLTYWDESNDAAKRQFLEDMKQLFTNNGKVCQIRSDEDFHFLNFEENQRDFPDGFYPKIRDPNGTVVPAPTDILQIACH